MCGITGFIDKKTLDLEQVVSKMAACISYRGPDDQGVWVDKEVSLAFGHRRLSIIDLSAEGHQPMHSASGRYVIVFNGEIYNYKEFQKELVDDGYTFRGSSDTEAMLAAFDKWGVEKAVQKFNGMFAFALWDKQDRRLFLVRDRIGIKPLYYGWSGSAFYFGSELKPFKVHPNFCAGINKNSLSLLFRHNYIPTPHSIYEGVYKLPPGCILTLSLEQLSVKPSTFSEFRDDPESNIRPASYWSLKESILKAQENKFVGTEQEAINELESIIKDSVNLRLISDVPLGAFLSGGIDSSTVVALMQSISTNPVKTFAIGFEEQQYNEAEYAKDVAKHLGTDHTELYLRPNDALDLIPSIPYFYDEPFSDASQLPTYLVSRLARKDVTVSLSGDGGDELFVGYERYAMGETVWKLFGKVPYPIRKLLAGTISSSPAWLNNLAFNVVKPAFPIRFQKINVGRKFDSAADVIRQKSFELMYRRLVSHWWNPNELVIGSAEPLTGFSLDVDWLSRLDTAQKMQYLDLVTYLPDDILTKVDRASMAVSLEARVPLLDHRVVEFSWRLPTSFKVKNQRKWILREVLKRYVPEELFDRPKTGFGIPIGHWISTELREWAESLLNSTRIDNEGLLNSKLISEKWNEHLSGKQNWEYYLWDVLMFQAWLDNESNTNNFEKDIACKRESA